jgi:hypothetical protein
VPVPLSRAPGRRRRPRPRDLQLREACISFPVELGLGHRVGLRTRGRFGLCLGLRVRLFLCGCVGLRLGCLLGLELRLLLLLELLLLQFLLFELLLLGELLLELRRLLLLFAFGGLFRGERRRLPGPPAGRAALPLPAASAAARGAAARAALRVRPPLVAGASSAAAMSACSSLTGEGRRDLHGRRRCDDGRGANVGDLGPQFGSAPAGVLFCHCTPWYRNSASRTCISAASANARQVPRSRGGCDG